VFMELFPFMEARVFVNLALLTKVLNLD